jgi:flagellar motor switch protein FliN
VPTLDKISLDVAVVLGSTTMPIHQALRLGRGAIIELDASEDDEVAILAGNLPIAKGNVVVNGNRIAVEVTEMRAAGAGQALNLPPLSGCGRFVTGAPLFAPCPLAGASSPHAVVAELVDALA